MDTTVTEPAVAVKPGCPVVGAVPDADVVKLYAAVTQLDPPPPPAARREGGGQRGGGQPQRALVASGHRDRPAPLHNSSSSDAHVLPPPLTAPEPPP